MQANIHLPCCPREMQTESIIVERKNNEASSPSFKDTCASSVSDDCRVRQQIRLNIFISIA